MRDVQAGQDETHSCNHSAIKRLRPAPRQSYAFVTKSEEFWRIGK